jgi:S-adenosylmethionine:tRNA ribosyltransferase-isomerase
MTATVEFTLPAELEAHEPPEARGLTRDGVRLMVGRRASGEVSHHRFDELPTLLTPGDVLVVNTSATMPAALQVLNADLRLHVSTQQPDGSWLVELRTTDGPFPDGVAGQRYDLPGGASVTLLEPYSRGRLWAAAFDVPSVPRYLLAHGVPIRYGYVPRSWPLPYYQTVFSEHPGSAEMPSASRPFTDRIVTRLVNAGVQFAPILLHTGVASPEAHERPYPERFSVPKATARLVNQARAAGNRVIGIGTTAVRALESAVDGDQVREAKGWTDLVITPERGVRVIDGLLTGFHEPMASHLDMLAAIADERLLVACYTEAVQKGYLWHEFGDVNLLLP